MCAKVVKVFDYHDDDTMDTPTIVNLDVKNAFNSTNRAGAFDSKTGKASREYDGGRVKVGDTITALPDIWPFFPYFQAAHGCAGKLRFTDHRGQLHHICNNIMGTKGGQ